MKIALYSFLVTATAFTVFVTGINWMTRAKDTGWHVLYLPHNASPVYGQTSYDDSLACIYSGESLLKTMDGRHLNSYQCVQGCNADHSICSQVIDSRQTDAQEKASDAYVMSLNLR